MSILIRQFFYSFFFIAIINSLQANELKAITQLAEQDNSIAQYLLGLMYQQGKAVEKKTDTAIDWYTRSANHNYLPAQYMLITIYKHEAKTHENNKKLTYWIDQLKNKKTNAFVDNDLKNTQKILNLLNTQALQNNTDAQYLLAMLYANNKNEKVANFWFLKAAQLGDKDAQYYIALVYEEKNGIINKSQSLQWLEKAAEQNLIDAQIMLGSQLEASDPKKAFYWYQKAAQLDDPSAQAFVGSMYRDGSGVNQDMKQAIYWYQKAAKQGDDYAQYNLGLIYETGNGVSKDITNAIYWYQKAAQQSHQASQLKLQILKQSNL